MKILVADDDDNFRFLITEVLKEAGHDVAACPDGLLAWEYLLAHGADLAVLDINMPELDGISLLRSIRADGNLRGMPVLLLTVRGFTEDQVRGYDVGADDYLTKPFSTEVLAARVGALGRRILGRKE